jgi:hypothetical protein
MKKMMILGAAGIAALTACSPVLVTGIPLTNILREPDGTETVLQGRIQPLPDFSSTFVTRSESGIECRGTSSNQGVMAIRCTNGWAINVTAPKGLYGKPNGSYADVVDGIGVAVGWGNQADVAHVRSLF